MLYLPLNVSEFAIEEVKGSLFIPLELPYNRRNVEDSMYSKELIYGPVIKPANDNNDPNAQDNSIYIGIDTNHESIKDSIIENPNTCFSLGTKIYISQLYEKTHKTREFKLPFDCIIEITVSGEGAQEIVEKLLNNNIIDYDIKIYNTSKTYIQ